MKIALGKVGHKIELSQKTFLLRQFNFVSPKLAAFPKNLGKRFAAKFHI
jgi:hypothetical protein